MFHFRCKTRHANTLHNNGMLPIGGKSATCVGRTFLGNVLNKVYEEHLQTLDIHFRKFCRSILGPPRHVAEIESGTEFAVVRIGHWRRNAPFTNGYEDFGIGHSVHRHGTQTLYWRSAKQRDRANEYAYQPVVQSHATIRIPIPLRPIISRPSERH